MKYANPNLWLLKPSVLLATIFLCLATLCHSNLFAAQEETKEATPSIEPTFFSNARQLTFEGLRAGEGYYNSDGTLMVFQSERRPDNPFFQIYLLDLQTGDTEPISPGHGKTTCSWIHPDNNLVLFSSTQDDPEARAKQKAEIEFRESGKNRRYAWDYDSTFEIYAFDRKQKTYTQLTKAEGYDAEGCYSPDGKEIVFASNRAGYDPALADELTGEDRKRFEIDLSYLMDIYLMNADGSNVRRLTKSPGYDGGPFFSQDGKKICWRRFSADGKTAEIFTMNRDGSDELQLTRMGALSWAPFFHPSGKYLIYNTNVHGFANFELYLVAADGKSLPVRVTDTDGFDGLANFTPDGKKLSWTSGRTAKKDSQIFVADWNHEGALKALLNSGIHPPQQTTTKVGGAEPDATAQVPQPDASNLQAAIAEESLDSDAFRAGQEAARQTKPGFDTADVKRHIEFLSGRELSRTEGSKKANSYVAGYLQQIGLVPAKGANSLTQSFEYPQQVEFNPEGRFSETFVGEEETPLRLGHDWSPLPSCASFESANRPAVFAGFGIVAPEQNGQPAYDSYADLKVSVKDKWVLVFNSAPANVEPARKTFLEFYGSLPNKMQYARERGALGLIVVDDAAAKLGDVRLEGNFLFASTNSSLAAIAINEQVAESWLSAATDSMDQLKQPLNRGEVVDPMEIPDLLITANVETSLGIGRGHDVIARLPANEAAASAIMISASLIPQVLQAPDKYSLGADSVSGVAGLLEVAEFLSAQKKEGKLTLKQDVIFAVWSGQSQCLSGSNQFAQTMMAQQPSSSSDKQFVITLDKSDSISVKDKPTTLEALESTFAYLSKNHPEYVVVVETDSQMKSDTPEAIRQLAQKAGIANFQFASGSAASSRPLNAVLHLDRIGRLDGKVLILGTGTSPVWGSAIESRNVVAGLPLATFNELLFPSDASSFLPTGVPVICAFTGPHADINSAGDTADKINTQGVASISQLMGLIARGLAVTDDQLAFVAPAPKIKPGPRSGGSASLGTIPSYVSDVVGVLISDVRPGTPAQKAGLKPNDIIVELAGEAIEDVQAYSDLLNELPIGKETEVVVERDGERLKFKITPIARQR